MTHPHTAEGWLDLHLHGMYVENHIIEADGTRRYEHVSLERVTLDDKGRMFVDGEPINPTRYNRGPILAEADGEPFQWPFDGARPKSAASLSLLLDVAIAATRDASQRINGGRLPKVVDSPGALVRDALTNLEIARNRIRQQQDAAEEPTP